MIVDYIRLHGSITAADAVKDLGIMGLSSRIAELKKSAYPIIVKTEKGKNRYGKPVRYSRYFLDGE